MNFRGFTIVELLIVIVVIAVLASITVVAFNGIQLRAVDSERKSEISMYIKAITIARNSTGKTLGQLTGDYFSTGQCSDFFYANNPQPKDAARTHMCWVRYYDNLSVIGQAANMNLNGLRLGDKYGNPYMFDENEGEAGSCDRDRIYNFYGSKSGIEWESGVNIPLSGNTGCAS